MHLLSFPNSCLGTLVAETPVSGRRETGVSQTDVPEQEFGNEKAGREKAGRFIPSERRWSSPNRGSPLPLAFIGAHCRADDVAWQVGKHTNIGSGRQGSEAV
jgi:hypothetical protein